MTTGTSSASDGAGQEGLPSWLPDEATLSRMANELFGARPEGAPASPPASPPSAAPTTVPRSPVPGASPGSMPFAPGIPDLSALLGTPRAIDAPPSYATAQRPNHVVNAPDSEFAVVQPRPQTPAPASPDHVARMPDRHQVFDVDVIRGDFPILDERVNGYPLAWFDNAATTQKPRAVIDRLTHFYEHENSNIHRAAHELAARSTDAYERARSTVARFLGASTSEEIIFVRGATEAINLVAQTWGRKHLQSGDEIVISHLEHHANIVPWQMIAAETGAVLRVIPVNDQGELVMSEYSRLLGPRTKLVSVTHVSNALGTVTPVHEIVAEGHRAGARVLIDGAQSVPHIDIDIRSLGADFFVFSGHKIYGPTGIGVLYGTSEVLQDLPPWQGGGNMISDVTLEGATYQPPPGRFEAGTGNIADAVGLGTALEYVERLGLANIERYEHSLLEYATPRMRDVPGLRLVGTAAEKASVASFVLDGYQPIEVGQALNEKGIAVRAGHHCAQPALRRYGLEATVRPSFAFYNTCAEIDRMIEVLHQLSADAGHRH